MSMIIYFTAVLILYVLGEKYGDKNHLRHALYTQPLFKALHILIFSVKKTGVGRPGGKLMLLYGRDKEKNLYISHLASKVASGILFLIFPVVLGSYLTLEFPEILVLYMMPIAGYFLPDIDLSAKIKQRKMEILFDFPIFCTELAVITGAGLSIMKAWEKAAGNSSESEFYREARLVCLKTETGTTFRKAIKEFSERIAFPEIHSFISVISQEIKSGGGVTEKLRECAVISWRTREDNARKRGEEAEAKIIFPLALGLAGVIIVLSAPAVILLKGI